MIITFKTISQIVATKWSSKCRNQKIDKQCISSKQKRRLIEESLLVLILWMSDVKGRGKWNILSLIVYLLPQHPQLEVEARIFVTHLHEKHAKEGTNQSTSNCSY